MKSTGASQDLHWRLPRWRIPRTPQSQGGMETAGKRKARIYQPVPLDNITCGISIFPLSASTSTVRTSSPPGVSPRHGELQHKILPLCPLMLYGLALWKRPPRNQYSVSASDFPGPESSIMDANSVALPEATASRQVRQNSNPRDILGGSGDSACSIVPAFILGHIADKHSSVAYVLKPLSEPSILRDTREYVSAATSPVEYVVTKQPSTRHGRQTLSLSWM